MNMARPIVWMPAGRRKPKWPKARATKMMAEGPRVREKKRSFPRVSPRIMISSRRKMGLCSRDICDSVRPVYRRPARATRLVRSPGRWVSFCGVYYMQSRMSSGKPGGPLTGDGSDSPLTPREMLPQEDTITSVGREKPRVAQSGVHRNFNPLFATLADKNTMSFRRVFC